jgi:hypothetical protein
MNNKTKMKKKKKEGKETEVKWKKKHSTHFQNCHSAISRA